MRKPNQEILDLELALDLSEIEAESLEIMLDEEEEILWEGIPDERELKEEIIRAKKFFSIAIKVLGYGFVGFFILTVVFGLTVGFGLRDIVLLLSVSFFISVLVFFAGYLISYGIYFIISILERVNSKVDKIYIKKIGKINYYYTPKRIIFQKGNSYQSLPFQQIKKIKLKKENQENGAIGFVLKEEYQKNAIQTKNLRTNEQRPWPTFELLSDVETVFKEISAVWESEKSNKNQGETTKSFPD